MDTGFGNALNVQRSVKRLAQAGASALQLEDQVTPKRCGHLAGKDLVSTAEMCGKIRAALDARPNDEVLLIARTDAIAVEGFDAALDRADAYLAAGADVLFIEAPQSAEQLAAIGKRFGGRIPLLANMVEGGKTPLRDAAELEKLGFSIAIFPGGTVRALAHHLAGYFASLKAHGSTAPFRDRMLDFKGINDIVGTDAMLERGKRYD
jgi:2-methylisocitrate lyase-like PEP mutase family enzyme